MELDRTTALTYFLRFLAGNPDGDAAARALVLGAMSPLGMTAAQVYAHDRASTLELAGNYGIDDEAITSYRVIATTMPMPICEAFATLNPLVVAETELIARYPILSGDPGVVDGSVRGTGNQGQLVYAPIMNSGVAIGALSLVQADRRDWEPADWQYLDGVLAGLSMWLNNQREILVDRWRRAAPTPQREVRITERQREILELVGLDRTNGEIAKSLGYSVPTIKKDLQHLMKLLGTHDRRTTAGRAREIGLLPERRGRE
jgi:DNA-binding CsgD family transcriptional regulator